MSGRAPGDAGFATVWAAGAVAVLVGLLVIGIELGAAVAARHRAEAAADLAALAAAGHAVHGPVAACGRAAGIAEQMDTQVRSCRLDGWEALVEVEAELRLGVVGPAVATGRARAGPVPVDPTDPTGPTDPADPAPATGPPTAAFHVAGRGPAPGPWPGHRHARRRFRRVERYSAPDERRTAPPGDDSRAEHPRPTPERAPRRPLTRRSS